MKIKRKKKKYSEKLFNELVLFHLLSIYGYFFEYEASFLLKVSNRTLRRYINEIEETCILYRGGGKLETLNENGYKSYHVSLCFFNNEKDPVKDALNPQTIILPIGFCQKHPKGLNSKNQHIVRLTRCALLLHKVQTELKKMDSTRMDIIDVVRNCINYYFDEIKINVSPKTFKRDILLVFDVLVYMQDK